MRRPIARRLSLLVAVAGAILVAGIFFVTADGGGLWQPLDDAGRSALRSQQLLGGRAFIVGTSLVMAVGLTLLAVWRAPACRRRRAAVASVGAVGLAAAVAWLLASMVRRPAPHQAVVIDTSMHDRSFPSIVGAVVMAATLRWVLAQGPPARRAAGLVAALTAPLAALRIATDASWLLDELAGALVGAVAVVCVWPSPRPVRRRPSRYRRRILAAAGAVGIAVGVTGGVSYASYLEAPGTAPFSDRTVEYLRDHGLSAFVDRAEAFWLWTHPPPTGGHIDRLPGAPLVAKPATPPTRTHPTTTASAPTTSPTSTTTPHVETTTAPRVSRATVPTASTGLPAPIALPMPNALAGEGQWTVAARDAAGRPELATTTFRPDPDHPTLVAAVAWINRMTTRFSLIAGLREPGGGPGPAGGQIPVDQRAGVLAAFNSGYRMRDHPGGVFVEGRLVKPLEPGLATAAIEANGRLDVGAWGTDVDPNGQYLGVRQNLHLMVDHGAVVDGVAINADQQWGSVKNALPTWRSGVGITATGDIVYVAGNHLSLGVLADIFVRAGAQRAMELDIHRGMVTFNLFSHDGGLVGHKLLPDMNKPADRYLRPDWRDFFTVTPAS